MLIAQAGQTVTRTVTETVPSINVEPSGGPSWLILVAVAGITALAALTAAIIAAVSASKRTAQELEGAFARQRAELEHDAGRQREDIRAAGRATDLALLRAQMAEAIREMHELVTATATVVLLASAHRGPPVESRAEYGDAVIEAQTRCTTVVERTLDLEALLGSTHPIAAAHAVYTQQSVELVTLAAECHHGAIETEDLDELDRQRRAGSDAFKAVLTAIRDTAGLNPTIDA